MATYIAMIRKDRASEFGVDFPDFPGCVSSGASLDQALHDAKDALGLHIKGMLADGEQIPVPSTLDSVLEDESNRDAVAVLVNVPELKSRAVRVNITIDEGLLNALDDAAAQEGTTRSGYLADAVRVKLRRTG